MILDKNTKNRLLLFGLAVVIFFIPQVVSSHPGRTAADGCHFCRTNCDSWGVAWNQRHCHGGYTAPSPVPVKSQPTKEELKQAAYNTLSSSTKLKVLVVEIVDGDTLKFFHSIDYSAETLRIIGMDTPETKDPRKPVQCFGKEASDQLIKLLKGKTIELRKDTINDNKDKYDRWLRYVYLDGQDISLKMIKDGYAFAYLKYPFEKNQMELYRQAEKEARENKRGLWADGVCDYNQSPTSTPTPNIIQQNIVKEQPTKKSLWQWFLSLFQ